jgi:hypothetical protein
VEQHRDDINGMDQTGDQDYPWSCPECGDYLTTEEAEFHACSSAQLGQDGGTA